MFFLSYGFGFGVLAFTPSTPKRAVSISVDNCTSANIVIPTISVIINIFKILILFWNIKRFHFSLFFN